MAPIWDSAPTASVGVSSVLVVSSLRVAWAPGAGDEAKMVKPCVWARPGGRASGAWECSLQVAPTTPSTALGFCR